MAEPEAFCRSSLPQAPEQNKTKEDSFLWTVDYAVGMGFVEKNVSRYVPGISAKHFAVEVTKDKTERVYLEDETDSLIDVCLARFEKTHNTAYSGLLHDNAIA